MNYSADALTLLFPSHFTPALAAQYARQPERIGNHLYANRSGNGDEASGDGFLYRGRGLLQITFKDNYEALAAALNQTLSDTIALAETQPGAALAAAWFWHANDLNRFAVNDDNVGLTRAINGGLMGVLQRNEYLATAKQFLQ